MPTIALARFALLVLAACSPALARAQAGQSAEPRIIGGTPVKHGQNTYQVALLANGDPDIKKAFYCGGAILNRTWILTAAHCV
jgi:secreted trypsin-like serine protease